MATKNSENTVEQHIHFPDVEEKILAFWEKEGIFEKSLEQRKNAPVFPCGNELGVVTTRVRWNAGY